MKQPCGNLSMMFALALLAAAWPTGCSMPANPWRFADPPTKGASVQPNMTAQNQPVVVVIGRFDDPSRAPNYSHGVGQTMSDAFSRTLLREGGFEIRINDRLAAEARRYSRFDAPGSTAAASAPPELALEQQQTRERIDRDRADVEYVILGKVTDFYHTSDMPEEASRRGIIGRRNEAVVSLDLRIVDMHTMQIVGTDHLMGAANAGHTRSHELYENVGLDSYLFWNTPLGRAGRRAIDRAINRAVAMMPVDRAHDGAVLARAEAGNSRHSASDQKVPADNMTAISEKSVVATPTKVGPRRFANARPQILRADHSRRITIMGGRNIGVEHGDRFHILRDVGVNSAHTLVNDAVTGRPLHIAVIDVSETTSTGWLLGQKPRQLDLRGMLLHLPDAALDTATAHVDPAAIETSP